MLDHSLGIRSSNQQILSCQTARQASFTPAGTNRTLVVLHSWRFSTRAETFHDGRGLGAHERKPASGSFSGWPCARPFSGVVQDFFICSAPPPHHPGPRESSQPGCLPHALTTKSPQRGQARLLTSPYSEGRGRHS